jgi:hypothetical protein
MCIRSKYTINGVTYCLYLGDFGNKLGIKNVGGEDKIVLYDGTCLNPAVRKTAKARKHLAALGADVLSA